MSTTPLDIATVIAVASHNGQLGKDGLPAVYHSLRVARSVATYARMLDASQRSLIGGDPVVTLPVIAMLHDVVCRGGTPDYVLHNEFSTRVARVVGILTRLHGETYEDYLARCGADPSGICVKLGCLQDRLETLGHVEDSARREQLELRYRAGQDLLKHRLDAMLYPSTTTSTPGIRIMPRNDWEPSAALEPRQFQFIPIRDLPLSTPANGGDIAMMRRLIGADLGDANIEDFSIRIDPPTTGRR